MSEGNNLKPNGLWKIAHESLVAKIIAECHYEECFSVVQLPTDDHKFELTLKSGVVYGFQATISIWGFLLIQPTSLLRNGSPIINATQLLLDAQFELNIADEVMGKLIEETNNTLYSELSRLKRLSAYTAKQMIRLPADKLQSLLSGHPKALANKGRMGWGCDELKRYSPESNQSFQLRFIAVDKDNLSLGLSPNLSNLDLLKHSLNYIQLDDLQGILARKRIHLQRYFVMPVHPWQWQGFIQTQFCHEIETGIIVDLGTHGDRYVAQQSIRTLSNLTRPEMFDIKLPLTILNTSCYRGIPGKYITTGAILSDWLNTVVDSDELLSKTGLIVQQEKAGVHVEHPIQSQIANTPYRYNEMLGAVWRDSLSASTSGQERSILLATLMETDLNGRGLICEYMEQSHLDTEAWLTALFDCVVIPLYHLLCCYGVGVIAHGQNVSLVLRNGIPVKASIKDFHGDLRLVDQEYEQLGSLPKEIKSVIARLPAEHLIHDLVTGHFVTTLRFISPIFAQQRDFPEAMFYSLLRNRVERYMKQHPHLQERFKTFQLFNKNILKICINRVRFRIGYNDDAQRPTPELGQPLLNPLFNFTQLEEAS